MNREGRVPALWTGVLVALASVACPRDTRVTPRDTTPVRWIAPRLSLHEEWRPCRSFLASDHAVEEVQCGGSNKSARPVSEASDCDAMTGNYGATLRTLATEQDCTEIVVDRLESVARANPNGVTLSDLAAAYYVRAQRKNRAADLMRALGSANRAVALAPRSPLARFNQALAQEALGFTTEAAATWDALRRDGERGWAGEADSHWRVLVQAVPDWPSSKTILQRAAYAGDAAAVHDVVSRYVAASQRYVEEDVLTKWAEARNAAEANGHLQAARTIAAQIAAVTHDRYVADATEAIVRADGGVIDALRAGHRAFGQARIAEHTLDKTAPVLYAQALRAFSETRSPLRAGAAIGRAITLLVQKNDVATAASLLDEAERMALAADYTNVRARVHANRAFILLFDSRYFDCLREYDAAVAQLERMGDRETLLVMRTRKMGVFRVLGQRDAAWREALQALRLAHSVASIQARHYFLGEMASTALALGYPGIALLYQNAAVDLLTQSKLDKELGIALRSRAAIRLELEQLQPAKEDLKRAFALIGRLGEDDDEALHAALLARVEEVEGLAALEGNDFDRAAVSFSRALDRSRANYYRTYRAILFLERSDARWRAGRTSAARRDITSALREIHDEERAMLAARSAVDSEDVWSAYFSRFDPVYDRLIAQQVQDKLDRAAFDSAERARAFEPLDLVLRLDAVPVTFRRLVSDGNVMSSRSVQAMLPRNTFVIEYSVLPDRVLVWVISNRDFHLLQLPLTRNAVAQWTSALQKAAANHDERAFEQSLQAPSRALLADALTLIDELTITEAERPRLVFIPHGPMFGLPFPALRGPSGRFLIEDYRVSTAPSATLFVFSVLRDRELTHITNPSVLLIGDPAFAQSDLTADLGPLPWARAEVATIRQLYGPASVAPLPSQATVPFFLDAARASSIIHLAAHAVVNPDSPSHSYLVLAPQGRDAGTVDAAQLRARLKASQTRLVVLSACSSAGGLPVGPEGVTPFVRALVAAGIPAVIGTVWSINDASSSPLLIAFHRHYRAGLDADRALQVAQLEMLRSKEIGLSSPLSWAPFQVIGFASSPFPEGEEQARRE